MATAGAGLEVPVVWGWHHPPPQLIEGWKELDGENDRLAIGQSRLPEVEVVGQELGFFHQEGFGFLVGRVAGGFIDQLGIKGPGVFGASPILLQAGDGILDAAAGIGDGFVFGNFAISGIELDK